MYALPVVHLQTFWFLNSWTLCYTSSKLKMTNGIMRHSSSEQFSRLQPRAGGKGCEFTGCSGTLGNLQSSFPGTTSVLAARGRFLMILQSALCGRRVMHIIGFPSLHHLCRLWEQYEPVSEGLHRKIKKAEALLVVSHHHSGSELGRNRAWSCDVYVVETR